MVDAVRPATYHLWTAAIDCSDEEFRCVVIEAPVLAVPREGLKRDSSYVVRGTALSVLWCLQEAGDECTAALIRAECPLILETRLCDPARVGKTDDKLPHWFLYFTYNASAGVTSFSMTTGELDSKPEIDRTARKYILVGDHGLLKP